MKNLFIVTVTYGQRNHFLQELIISLSNIEFEKVIVVDNNSNFNIDETPKEAINKILHIKFDENTGSANGYKTGIEMAYKRNAEYVMLLDDDNKLMPENFKSLSGEEIKNNKLIYALNRVDQWSSDKILESKFLTENNYNSFLNFNLKNKFLSKKNNKNDFLYSAPFGGLIIPRSAISIAGLPNTDFYLYADDTEYCLRLRTHGYSIKFIDEVKISDIEESWYMNKNLSSLDIKLKIGTDLKTYYTTRNNAFISNKILKKNSQIYLFNKYFYLLMLLIRSIQINRIERFLLIKQAINDGEIGKLGINKKFKLR